LILLQEKTEDTYRKMFIAGAFGRTLVTCATLQIKVTGTRSWAMKKNERYRCVNPKCCCEIDVLKESSDAHSVRNPRCVCGQDMKRMY
jgi:hypothetical protein